MSYQLRPLRLPDDLPRIQELLAESRLRQTVSACPAPVCRLGAIDSLGRMVGFGQVQQTPEAPVGRFELTIAVEPFARGNGAGTLLLEELEAFARSRGATQIRTEVRDDDASALTFMQHWGYDLAGEHAGGFLALTKSL